jgi:SNF2 family DNA or RNA helicase
MQYKRFQKQDYARLALTDSAILGHDTGLGKTWAGYTFGLLKCGFERDLHRVTPRGAVLIIAPGDLHKQWIREGAEHFKVHVTRLDCQETFLQLSTLDARGRRSLPPGFYITSYTELGHNGVRLLPNPAKIKTRAEAEAILEQLGLSKSIAPSEGEEPPLVTARKCVALRIAWMKQNAGLWNTDRYEALPRAQRVRTAAPTWRTRCVVDPTLADLCADTFQCVVVDEGTKLKGGFETQIGAGVLQLNPPYRLVCTATPIKNRLPNLFPLAWWACGGRLEAHSRWPYTLEDAGDFAKTFCVSERNLTKERQGGALDPNDSRRKRSSRFTKLTPQVCNVHKVWKLLAPIILRRRKKDIGEDIVGKSRQVYRVPMGRLQAEVYKAHLNWNPVDKNGMPAIGPKLQALRMAAAAPHSALLPRARGPAYCPKMAATLTLIEQILRRGRQVIVFSPFHDPLDEIARRLKGAGVGHYVLDGRMSQAKRGLAADRFKKQDFPVLLASNECMAEGHSFPRCSYVIQYAYPWALDKVLQSEDRAHRLNSVEPLQVYRLITEGSVDRKMESQIDEKADAAELVLDGHLLGEASTEVNLAELLEIAAKEFENNQNATIEEATLEAEWPGLRDRLRAAAAAWDPRSAMPARPIAVPPLVATPEPPKPEAKLHWRQRWQKRQALIAA